MPSASTGALHIASRRIEDGPTATVREPWSGAELGRVVLANEEHAEEAVAASVRAFDRLRTRSSHERKAVLTAVVREIEVRKDVFADLIAREAGKPITQARTEVARALATFQLGAEEATRIGGEVIPLDTFATSRGYTGMWTRVPAGPVIALAPFNFPLILSIRSVAPALALGNAVVLKPDPRTAVCGGVVLARAGAPV